MEGGGRRGHAFHWWIDAVGGYLAFTGDRVQVGSAGNPRNDIPILGDLSRQHAELLREAQGTVLIAHAETTVNGRPGGSFLLKDGDEIRMRSVALKYHRPVSWSRTARLEIVSGNRLPLALEGVLLLSETCVLGRRRDAHVPAPWDEPVCVTWHRDRYWLRGPGDLRIDGQDYPGWGPLGPAAKVKAAWGAFRWEPVRPAEPPASAEPTRAETPRGIDP